MLEDEDAVDFFFIEEDDLYSPPPIGMLQIMSSSLSEELLEKVGLKLRRVKFGAVPDRILSNQFILSIYYNKYLMKLVKPLERLDERIDVFFAFLLFLTFFFSQPKLQVRA